MSKHDKDKVKIRKSWGDLDPATKVHKDQSKYNRAQAKKQLKSELENNLTDETPDDESY
jgi:hypothetical protein